MPPTATDPPLAPAQELTPVDAEAGPNPERYQLRLYFNDDDGRAGEGAGALARREQALLREEQGEEPPPEQELLAELRAGSRRNRFWEPYAPGDPLVESRYECRFPEPPPAELARLQSLAAKVGYQAGPHTPLSEWLLASAFNYLLSPARPNLEERTPLPGDLLRLRREDGPDGPAWEEWWLLTSFRGFAPVEPPPPDAVEWRGEAEQLNTWTTSPPVAETSPPDVAGWAERSLAVWLSFVELIWRPLMLPARLLGALARRLGW